jgi:hypothetical protein
MCSSHLRVCDDHDLTLRWFLLQSAQQRQGSDRRWVMHEEGAAWQQEGGLDLEQWFSEQDKGGELILRARHGGLGLGDPRSDDDAFHLCGKPSVTLHEY